MAKHINELLTPGQKNEVEQKKPLSDLDIELVNYMFYKIELTWGHAKYMQQFSDEKTLEDTKRDWAHDLITTLAMKRYGTESYEDFVFRAKSRLDTIFTEIRQQVDTGKGQAWEWPQLKKIMGYMANHKRSPAHKAYRSDRALPDLTKKERDRVAGRSELDKMKGLFK